MLLSDERVKKLKSFCKKFGLKFKNLELLNRAFCHMSYIYEIKEERCECYEKLEFLGDAVLKLAVSDILLSEFSDKNEGGLSACRSSIVSDRTISDYAKKLGFENLILTGKSEDGCQKSIDTILACSFEAFLGAIYLEFEEKGYETAKNFLIKNFKEDIINSDISNPKAELQEYTQKINHNLPEYKIIFESGPAHNKSFVSAVFYNGEKLAEGSASSKKESEFIAAKNALANKRRLWFGGQRLINKGINNFSFSSILFTCHGGTAKIHE